MMPQLARVADAYSVPVYSNSGFASLTAVRSIVWRATQPSVPTVLLHVGDFDPSGEAIFAHIAEDAAAFLAEDRSIGPQRIVAERVALTADQVAEHKLPAPPVKTAKTKQHEAVNQRWRRGHGNQTCHLEALAPALLARLVRDAIARRLDPDLVSAHERAEAGERVQLLRALPTGETP